VSGGFLDKLARVATGAVLITKLAKACRTVDGWVAGIWDWLGRAITRRTGWAWPGRGCAGVDEKARPVEAAAEVATERPGRRIGLAETQRAGWLLPDPPPKPHRERARRSPNGRKQENRDERKRAPTKPPQKMGGRVRSSIARLFPWFAAMASADAAKAPRGRSERECESATARASSIGPSPPQPRQSHKAQPGRNGSARAHGPGPAAAAATGATPDHPAPGRRRPRFDSSLNLNLDIDGLFQRGFLVPGALTHGIFRWPDGACPVSYVADLTDPAAAWIRLWSCIIDLETRHLRPVHQQVWLARMQDSTWQFFHKGGTSGWLVLRPGARGFKFPPVPGARRASRRPPECSQPRGKPTPAKTPAARIHIDELFANGVLKPGELRNGLLHVRVGDDIFVLRFDADLFDPTNAHLWLHGPIRDKLIHQKVVLALGDGRWWFLQQGRIDLELTLRGDCFQIPRPPRFTSQPPCIPPQQPAQPCGVDVLSARPQEPTLPDGTDVPTASIQDANDARRANSTQARRGGWLGLKLTVAASTAKRAVASGLGWIAAGTCSLLAGIAMRFMSRLGIVDRSRPAV